MDKSFYGKIQAVIDNNEELKNSFILKAVLESVEYKNEDQYLKDLKARLEEVNTHLNNDDLANIITSIDTKIGEEEAGNLDQYVDNQSNEFDLQSTCDTVCNQMSSAEPGMCSTIKALADDQMNTGKPSYQYLIPMMQTMEPKLEYSVVKESYDAIKSYIDSNKEKLTMIDTIQYFRSMGNYGGVNPKAVTVLKECLHNKEYNPDIISMKLGDMSSNGTLSNMLDSLRSIRVEKTEQCGIFDLSESKNDTKVYDYMGPVLREGKSITLYVDNTFINITDKKKSGNDVKNVINEGVANIYELTDLSVYKNSNGFYNTVKAFESLGFQLKKGGVQAKLNRSSVDFRINESSSIDFYINGNKMETISEAKSSDVLAMETTATKACLYNLLENVNTIYNIPFVKFLINENRNKVSMVMNIAEDYYVYDFVNESKTNVYKLDAYKLYEFCLNEFGFDISSTFNVAINDKSSKLSKVNEQKAEILNMIDTYKNSIKKIDEAKKSDLRDDDRKELDELTKSLFDGIQDLQKKYQNLCESEDRIRFSKNDMINEGEYSNVASEAAADAETTTTETINSSGEIEEAEIDPEEPEGEELEGEEMEGEEMEPDDIEAEDADVDAPDVEEPEVEEPDTEEPEVEEPEMEDPDVEEADVEEADVEESDVEEPEAEEIEADEPEAEEIDAEPIDGKNEDLTEGANAEVPEDAEEINEGEPESEEVEDSAEENTENVDEGSNGFDDFDYNFTYNNLLINVAPDQKEATIFDMETQDVNTVSIGINDGDVYLDPDNEESPYHILFDDLEEGGESESYEIPQEYAESDESFTESDNMNESLNESLLLEFSIFKRGRIKEAGRKYADTMAENMKQGLVAAAKLARLNKAGKGDSEEATPLKEQIKIAADKRKTIKGEFEAECDQIFAKLKNQPNRLNRFKKFKAKIENDVNKSLMDMAKKLEENGIIDEEEVSKIKNNISSQKPGEDTAFSNIAKDIINGAIENKAQGKDKNGQRQGQGQNAQGQGQGQKSQGQGQGQNAQGQGQSQKSQGGDPAQNVQTANNDPKNDGLEEQLAAESQDSQSQADSKE